MSKKVIELRFDTATETRIRALVASLDPNASRVTQPHVSLAVFDDADAKPLIDAAKRVATIAPIDVRLAGVGAFPGDQRALFLLPTLTGPLHELHDRLHAALGVASNACWPLYRPGEWVPHCTLATGVPDVGATIDQVRTTFAFGPARLESIVVRELNPDRDLATFPLTPAPRAPALDVRDGLRLRPVATDDAIELFALIDVNRAMLREWLPWLDGMRSVDDERTFLAGVVGRAATVFVIEADGVACGICGFNAIDVANGIAEIGYWLAASHQRRGIMTACVERLVLHAFDDLRLHRLTIAIAVENRKSRAIAERLAFREEGVLREAEWLYDRRVDHVLYARIRDDATNSSTV